MKTLYETQTPNSIQDRAWYWVRYRAEYMQMWGQWIASQGATIKMYSKTTACQIVGPIQEPESE